MIIQIVYKISEYINVDKFINEIHQRLATWDSELNESSNKYLRNKAREELCRTFSTTLTATKLVVSVGLPYKQSKQVMGAANLPY